MPYRYAHWWLLALFPLIVVAFWPGYFGHLTAARLAQHAHGITATGWLALLMVQSWSAHAKRIAWHRAAGLAVFAIVPLFAAAGLYAVRDMAAEMNRGSPFESLAAPSLAPDDLSSIVALVGFAAAALATRRRPPRHAAWMLATALLVLPPMTTRLIQVLAHLSGLAAPSLWTSFVLGTAVTIAAALFLAYGRRDHARPFLILAALCLGQIVSYSLLGTSSFWRGVLAAFGESPPLPSAVTAAISSLAILFLAWRRVPRQGGRASNRSVTLGTATPIDHTHAVNHK